MFGVSTCWRSRSIGSGADLARLIHELGVNAVELDYRLSAPVLRALLDECSAFDITPVSVHAVCPAPSGKKRNVLAERFELCCVDEDERRQAVADVAGTIRLAEKTGAGAVVVHAGAVPMRNVTYQLQHGFDNGEIGPGKGGSMVNKFKIMRLAQRGNTFDQLLKSVEELNITAEKSGVVVGLENRYHMWEYPAFEEMAVILLRMSGSNIKYWHDTGHAKAQENLGILPYSAWLDEFGDDLAGVHLHDIDGYTDHYPPPSSGKHPVDFRTLKKYLTPETPVILEMRDDITQAQASAGVQWLKAGGIV